MHIVYTHKQKIVKTYKHSLTEDSVYVLAMVNHHEYCDVVVFFKFHTYTMFLKMKSNADLRLWL